MRSRARFGPVTIATTSSKASFHTSFVPPHPRFEFRVRVEPLLFWLVAPMAHRSVFDDHTRWKVMWDSRGHRGATRVDAPRRPATAPTAPAAPPRPARSTRPASPTPPPRLRPATAPVGPTDHHAGADVGNEGSNKATAASPPAPPPPPLPPAPLSRARRAPAFSWSHPRPWPAAQRRSPPPPRQRAGSLCRSSCILSSAGPTASAAT